MSEKRRAKRKNLLYYLNSFSRQNKELLGQIIDLTEEGMMMIGVSPFEKDKLYQLNIEIKDEILPDQSISMDALCAWAAPDVNPKFNAGGFQFLNVSSHAQDSISKLIQNSPFN